MSAAFAGGALAIGFRLSPRGRGLVPTQHTEILNWIIIEPNNTVTIWIAQPEMGQGIITSTAQLLAEELEVDWSRIKVEFISIATHLRRQTGVRSDYSGLQFGVQRVPVAVAQGGRADSRNDR